MVVFVWLLTLFSSPVSAFIPSLYVTVAVTEDLPAKELYILAITESKVMLTNGVVRPWPWTLNVKGQSYYYQTRQEACQSLTSFLTQTALVDIGLTQLNWRYQGDHFDKPCDVFEPLANLTHAARLLKQGKRLRGSWVKAAGWFHRPAGGAPAERYMNNYVTNYKRY
ncbi:hypothetical protein C9J12_21195 [Photobacterium frigidiphilum]|uniref:Transglycosylase SLT domain-containing protein n=1 Tax=Photobacterium frigidiphilum TaxID=264736 RepID=A0A2T3JAC6_9GAMM|nr:hypothetical protein C9J12_21195 [Photobacterium frigidiphilum]